MKPSVCMCLYQRVHNLPDIIKALENQTYKKFDFCIWNNNVEKRKEVAEIIVNTTLNIFIHHADKNYGSQARFWLTPKCTGNPIMFFDDDQIPHEDFVEYMLDEYRLDPRAVKSWKSRVFTEESYWANSKGGEVGDEVDYLGTGGMVVGKELLLDERVQNIPPVCNSVEDLYLSFIARTFYNYSLIRIKRKVHKRKDKLNQYSKIKRQKELCFQELRKQGFTLLRD